MNPRAAIRRPSARDVKQCIIRHLSSLKSLPTTVPVAVRLFELQKHEGAEAAEYARVIASDAGITARILALANSSYFGVSMRITQPMVAVNLLGIAAVRTLAINLCLSGLHHELRLTKNESQEYWEASLCKAVAARQLVRRLDPKLAEDAYVTGLFQDIALPVMYAAAREKVKMLLEERMSAGERLQREREVCGGTHSEFGEILVDRLGLPKDYVSLIGTHHDLEALRRTAGSEALAAGAYAASLFPHRLDRWDGGDVKTLREFLANLGGQNVNLEEFLGMVSVESKREFAYFDRAKVTEIRLLELMTEAIRNAAEATVSLVGQVQEMKQQVATADEAVARLSQETSRLAEEAARDPLTGVLNRAAFERECRASLIHLQRENQPVALLYLDLDHFKEINDVCGHAAGDEALRQIVAVVRECTRATDLVGRLGGDEFAVLLANCPQNKTAEIAERLRLTVAARRVKGRALSASVGVRWIAAGEPATLEWLLTASDQRMYVAKRDGGNRVSMQTE